VRPTADERETRDLPRREGHQPTPRPQKKRGTRAASLGRASWSGAGRFNAPTHSPPSPPTEASTGDSGAEVRVSRVTGGRVYDRSAPLSGALWPRSRSPRRPARPPIPLLHRCMARACGRGALPCPLIRACNLGSVDLTTRSAAGEGPGGYSSKSALKGRHWTACTASPLLACSTRLSSPSAGSGGGLHDAGRCPTRRRSSSSAPSSCRYSHGCTRPNRRPLRPSSRRSARAP
jgi:hypothetical protein